MVRTFIENTIWYAFWNPCLGGVYIPHEFCNSILSDFDACNVLMDSSVWFRHFVDFFPFSLVQTDENSLIRIRAFSLLLFIRCPRSFNGATPKLSCFLDLTYFQNGIVLFLAIPSSIAEYIQFDSAFLIGHLHSFW